jgi:purine-binding chemotaxis protein CheW
MQLCTYRLADMWFGIDATAVQEVLRRQVLTPVPLAQPCVAGLLNIRGQIVTAVDVRPRLGLAVSMDDPLHVVATFGTEPVSLVVDAIGGVVSVDEESFEAAPATLPASLRHVVTGAYKLPARLVMLLDLRAAIDARQDKPKPDAKTADPKNTDLKGDQR